MWDRIIEPMKPVSHPRVFIDSNFLFQVKWDGVRMLAYIDNEDVTLINKNLINKTAQFPELSDLSKLLPGKRAIVDGEIIVLKDGKPHFPSILRRNLCQSPAQITLLSELLPVVYMIFDLIWLDDRDLRQDSLELRNSLLNDCLKWQAPFHLVESFADGAELFTAVKESSLEGIVAKRKSSPYTEGKKHNDWLKIKYRRRQTFVIGGFTCNHNKVNALLTGLYDKNSNKEKLFYVGKVGTGLKDSEWDLLSEKLPQIIDDKSPFVNLNKSQLKQGFFIKPLLTVEIEFAEFTDSLHLRAPVIIGFSSFSPEQCHF